MATHMLNFRALKLLLLTLSCLILAQQPALADDSSHFYMAGGGESWLTPNLGGNGYFILSYDRPKTIGAATLNATLNTDTIQLTLDGFRLSPAWTWGTMLKGEAVLSGLLPFYYQEGVNLPARGFNATFIQGAVFAKYGNAPHFVDIELSGRQWFFSRNATTSQAFQLPPNTAVFEPRLRYTYWAINHDEAISKPHRHYWRVHGLAFGAQAGVDVRTQTGQWGARDPTSFVADNRNTSQRFSAIGNLWARAGAHLAGPLRVQGMLTYSHGYQLDDLNRVRAGGMNPYVLPVSGIPWASLLPDNILASEVSLHTKVLQNSEIGLMAQSAWMTKANLLRVTKEQRSDGAQIGALVGVGLFGDFRFDTWQVDTRLGWALPSAYLDGEPHLSLWVSVGKQLW